MDAGLLRGWSGENPPEVCTTGSTGVRWAEGEKGPHRSLGKALVGGEELWGRGVVLCQGAAGSLCGQTSTWDIAGLLSVTGDAIIEVYIALKGLPWWLSGTASACQRRRLRLQPMATHYTLARRIPPTEKPGRLKPTGMQSRTQLSDQITSSYKVEPLLPMCSVSPKRWEFFKS